MSPALACRVFATETPGKPFTLSGFKQYSGISYSCQIPEGP